MTTAPIGARTAHREKEARQAKLSGPSDKTSEPSLYRSDVVRATEATPYPLNSQRKRQSHLPAAVCTNDNVSAARVVPAGAKVLKIGTATAGYVVQRARRSCDPLIVVRKRVREIEKVIEHRSGGPCDTHDGEAYFEAALPHLLVLPPTRYRITDPRLWCKRWCPVLFAEKDQAWFDQMIENHRNRRLLADQIGLILRLTSVERSALQIQTIGAIDRPKEQRLADRKAANRERERQRRAKQGAKARGPISVREQCRAAGISPATYYRRLQKGLPGLPQPHEDTPLGRYAQERPRAIAAGGGTIQEVAKPAPSSGQMHPVGARPTFTEFAEHLFEPLDLTWQTRTQILHFDEVVQAWVADPRLDLAWDVLAPVKAVLMRLYSRAEPLPRSMKYFQIAIEEEWRKRQRAISEAAPTPSPRPEPELPIRLRFDWVKIDALAKRWGEQHFSGG